MITAVQGILKIGVFIKFVIQQFKLPRESRQVKKRKTENK